MKIQPGFKKRGGLYRFYHYKAYLPKPPIDLSQGLALFFLLILSLLIPMKGPHTVLAMDSFSSDFGAEDSFQEDSSAQSFSDASGQDLLIGETYWQEQPIYSDTESSTTQEQPIFSEEASTAFSADSSQELFQEANQTSFGSEVVAEASPVAAPVTTSLVVLPNGEEGGVSNTVDYSRWEGQLNETRLTTQFAPFATLTNSAGASSMMLPTMQKQLQGSSSKALPSSFDHRGYDTSVKNQEPYNLCWAFALFANLEHSLKLEGYGDLDLSEEHLAYYFSNRTNDPLGNTPYDYNLRLSSKQNSYRSLGNPIWAALHLSTWSGAVLEERAPYPTDETHSKVYSYTTATQVSPYAADVYLKDAYFFDEFSTNAAKRIIYEYGSLCTALRMYDAYLNPLTNAFSCAVDGLINHDVLLVGWDDSYPKENFLPETGVTHDGAFIAKNSWGSSWGEDGYFYISYESKGLRGAVCATATMNPAYPHNYFYDGTGRIDGSIELTGEGSCAALANVFVAKAGNGRPEALGEVVIHDYSHQNKYGIQIYTDLTDPQNPTSGKKAFEKPLSYNSLYAGIKTVTLPQEVILTPGSRFSVVITNRGEDPITYLMAESGDLSDGIIHFTNATAPGESFRYDSSLKEWIDLGGEKAGANPTSSARIKLHTRTVE